MTKKFRLKHELIANKKIKEFLGQPSVQREIAPKIQINITCKYVHTLAKAIVDSDESGYKIIDALYWLTGWRQNINYMRSRKINAVERLSKIPSVVRNEIVEAIKKYYCEKRTLLGRWGIGKAVLRGLKNKNNLLQFKELLKTLVYEMDVNKLDAAVDNFAKKRMKDVTVGTISPILYCLQPILYPILNNKTHSFFNILCSEKRTNDLRDYVAMARVVRDFRNCYGLPSDLYFFDYMGVDYAEGKKKFGSVLKREIKYSKPMKIASDIREADFKIPNQYCKGKKEIIRDLDDCGRAKKMHEILRGLLINKLHALGYSPKQGEKGGFDLSVEINGTVYLFEVKSNCEGNFRTQMRLAIGQLFEYEYLYYPTDRVKKCVVFETKPGFDLWLDLLEKHIGILILWKTNDNEFLAGPLSQKELNFLFS